MACQPYRAQTKGKVERPFHDPGTVLNQEQFLRGLKVSDLREFEARLFAFTFRKRLSIFPNTPPLLYGMCAVRQKEGIRDDKGLKNFLGPRAGFIL